MRVLALDYGSARCGCAVSDVTGSLATPIEAVPKPDTPAGMEQLEALVMSTGAERVVVGLPVNLNGSEGQQARTTRKFARRLADRVIVPVDTYDERFTTRMAERSTGPKVRTSEDSRAAAHLLESYLSANSNG